MNPMTPVSMFGTSSRFSGIESPMFTTPKPTRGFAAPRALLDESDERIKHDIQLKVARFTRFVQQFTLQDADVSPHDRPWKLLGLLKGVLCSKASCIN